MLQFHTLVRQHNESVEEWMGRLRTAAMELKYKEVNKQLKEQFIHGLNDQNMLTEIIRQLTKSDENMIIPSEHVLTSVKRAEAQRDQTAVFNSSHKVKNFDTILQKDEGKWRQTKPATPVKQPVRRRC